MKGFSKYMNKKISIILGISICLSIFGGIFWLQGQNQPTNGKDLPIASPTPIATVKPDEKVSFVAAGDNLIHGMLYIQASARAGHKGYDFSYVYENIKDYIKAFDVAFINQETLVNSAFAPSTYPRFSTPTDLGDEMIDVGFDIFGTSNNHSYDMGAEGIKSSLEYWNGKREVINVGFYTGDDEKDIEYSTVNGIKMAFLAYTSYTNGLSIYDEASPKIILTSEYDTLERQIKKAKENADIVIVSCHWGAEDSNNIIQQQKDVATKISEFGADVIIGTHPHVVQTVEWATNEVNDNKTLVCYSLGNFISAQSAANNMLGGLLQFDIVKKYTDTQDSYKIDIENPYFVPTITHYDYNYSNIRNYLLKDYTLEMSKKHGVLATDLRFSFEKLEWIINEYIPKEFLLYK